MLDTVHNRKDIWIVSRGQLQHNTEHSYAVLVFNCFPEATVALAVVY